jgi:hypothetical protein
VCLSNTSQPKKTNQPKELGLKTKVGCEFVPGIVLSKKLAPFGLSDHCTIKVLPKTKSTTKNMFKVIRSRDLRQSNKNAVGRTLSAVIGYV